jgi:hypothetical protein
MSMTDSVKFSESKGVEAAELLGSEAKELELV